MLKEKFENAGDGRSGLWFWLFSGLFAAACLLSGNCTCPTGGVVEGLPACLHLSVGQRQSYFDAANGGFAGTFLNAAIVCAVCAAIYSLPGSKPDGVSVLAYFLTAGFCFWGITVLNIWFCFAGVLIGCLIRKVKFYTQGNVFLFSTGIAPLMTEFPSPPVSGRRVTPQKTVWSGVTFFGCVLALLACCLIGLILPAGLTHGPKMHKGYDLYNAAVPIERDSVFLRAVTLPRLGGRRGRRAGGVAVGEGHRVLTNVCNFCIVVFVLALVFGSGAWRQL